MNDSILDLDKQLCFRLYSVSRKMTKAYQPFLQKYNLTYPQYIVMLAVFKAKTIDFKELGHKVNLQTGTLTPIIKKLEEMAYVDRVRNNEDHRKMNVVLTEQGQKLHQEIVEVPIGLSEKLQVSIEMYETLVKELDELDEMLDQVI